MVFHGITPDEALARLLEQGPATSTSTHSRSKKNKGVLAESPAKKAESKPENGEKSNLLK